MNILLDENNVCKLADFGCSDFFKTPGDDTFDDSVGTYQFFSPLMCSPDVPAFSGKAADVWALGVTLYAMVFSKLPFDAESENDLFKAIREDEL